MLRFLALFSLSFLLVTTIAPAVRAIGPINQFFPKNQVSDLVEATQTLLARDAEIVAKNDEDKDSESYEEIVEGKEKLEGLFTVYSDLENGKLFLELKPEQLNKNFLCFVTLNSGIGESFLIRGMSLGDFLFQWRKHQNSIQFVMPNINFRTDTNDPQKRSVDSSFSDSILYSMPIQKIHPERGTILIDL
ncbi:MAG: DUF5118 domain-containing protein, partial [Okeania sp. SIO2H7]|nr:DUF5118 domain-containing protein [Okeania sp. SIO2H7]